MRCSITRLLLGGGLLLLVPWMHTCCSDTTTIMMAQAQPPEFGSADAGYEFVQEILEEETDHYGDQSYDNPYVTEEQIMADNLRREELERQIREKEEQMAKEKAEEEARLREEAFERELSRMNEEQAKKARKKKKADAKVVKRILRAAAKEDHYGVLGLRNLDIAIPPRSFGIGKKFVVRFPGFHLFHASAKDIRKAYRKLSVTVHPDRNRDGHANEAFIALENSASILSDETQRAAYDEQIRFARRKRRKQVTGATVQALNSTWTVTTRAVAAFRTILGPFAFPALILGSLIV